ncbi:hypothetical protein CALCODRAFT_80203 [Calocera cornea HHB12733]|uniref:Uncharacterized protein n=1 Tax=Calocera cornea HHB12733 TaxID=1353952 RepID=A0A165DEU7_9BASI|nr:hypothetical protein CALCODRAFT_80203 [Calocera cornea HHB12733]
MRCPCLVRPSFFLSPASRCCGLTLSPRQDVFHCPNNGHCRAYMLSGSARLQRPSAFHSLAFHNNLLSNHPVRSLTANILRIAYVYRLFLHLSCERPFSPRILLRSDAGRWLRCIYPRSGPIITACTNPITDGRASPFRST